MSKIYCPFSQADCEPNCIFSNGCFEVGDSENCNLKAATDLFLSFSTSDNPLESRLKQIRSDLYSIDSSVSRVDADGIKSVLDDIKSLLEKMPKN